MDKSVFEIVVFGDKCLLEDPVEEWPVVDCLIAFYSTGYPLNKAQAYVELRRPFVFNDLSLQHDLMDRRRVYQILESVGYGRGRGVGNAAVLLCY